MTKPVRGWTDEDMEWYTEWDDRDYFSVCKTTDGFVGTPIPVLVVPIDDASVEAMAAKMYAHTHGEQTLDVLRKAYGDAVADETLRITADKIRAALGLTNV